SIAAPEVQSPSPVTAKLVVFPMGGGEGRLAWQTDTEADEVGWYQGVGAAPTGEGLYRRNYYQAEAAGTSRRGRDPHRTPGRDVPAREVGQFSGDAAFDNAGWVSGATSSGNAVVAYQDLNNTNTVGFQPTTPAAPDPAFQHFDFPFADAYRLGNHTDVTTDAS